jgi:hypothetical protein
VVILTSNQLRYWQNVETARANRANEELRRDQFEHQLDKEIDPASGLPWDTLFSTESYDKVRKEAIARPDDWSYEVQKVWNTIENLLPQGASTKELIRYAADQLETALFDEESEPNFVEGVDEAGRHIKYFI